MLCYRELAIHRHKELIVVLGVRDSIFDEFHRLNWVHICKVLSKNPDALNNILIVK